MHALITDKLDDLRALCVAHSVKSLYLFGSATTDQFDPDHSDLDFLVEFLPGARGGGLRDVYFQLRDDLRDLLGRDVDLVEAAAVRNPYVRRSIQQSRIPLYAAA